MISALKSTFSGVLKKSAALSADTPLDSMLGPWRFGILVIIAFFGLGGGVAAFAPLSSAVMALGAIAADGTYSKVQSLEGGIISDVLVKEGQILNEGEAVLVLTNRVAEADRESVLQRLRQAAVREHRLLSEQINAAEMDITHPELLDLTDPVIARIITNEKDLFEARRDNLVSMKSILNQRILQLRNQNVGHSKQLSSLKEQIEIVKPELESLEAVLEKGLVPMSRVTSLRQRRAQLEGSIGEVEANIARVNETIAETQIEISRMEANRLEEVSEELATARTERKVAEEQLVSLQDTIQRATITAPTSGRVYNLQHTVKGGVAGPGEVLFEIVPNETRILVETRVRPVDVDSIYIGQNARVLFSALPSKRSQHVDGTVRRLTADVVSDEQGNAFYLAQIEVDPDSLEAKLPDFEPQVGMPAQAFIQSEDRTLLSYIVSPITDLWRQALNEE